MLKLQIQKEVKFVAGTIMYAVMLLMLTMVVAQETRVVDIIPLKENPGLYYEKLNVVRMKRADWRIVIFLDLQDLLKEPGMLITHQEMVRKCVNLLKVEAECIEERGLTKVDRRIKQLKELFKKILDSAEGLRRRMNQEVMETRSLRARRLAPLGIIGSISKSLFGLVTEDDVQGINANIDTLFRDQKDMVKLVEQQSHIVTGGIEELYNITNKEDEELKEFGENMSKAWNKLYELETSFTSQQEYRSFISRIEDEIEMNIDLAKQLLDIIKILKLGQVPLSILKDDTVNQITEDIKKYTYELDFPIPMDHLRAGEIAKLAAVDAIYQDNRILVILHLPLVDRQGYDLFQIYPVAIRQSHENKVLGSAFVQPTHPYIMLRRDQRNYVKLTREELSKCRQMHYAHICEPNLPFREVSTSTECEIGMLIDPSVETLRNCEITHRRENSTQWQRLSDGSWLYSCMDKETLVVTCMKGITSRHTIGGIGILRLAAGCMSEANHITLYHTFTESSNKRLFYETNFHLNISKYYTITPQIADELIHKTSDVPRRTNTWKARKESLSDIMNRVQEIGRHERKEYKMNGIIYGGVSLQACLIFVVGGLAIWYRQKSKIRNTREVIRISNNREPRPPTIHQERSSKKINETIELPIYTTMEEDTRKKRIIVSKGCTVGVESG